MYTACARVYVCVRTVILLGGDVTHQEHGIFEDPIETASVPNCATIQVNTRATLLAEDTDINTAHPPWALEILILMSII